MRFAQIALALLLVYSTASADSKGWSVQQKPPRETPGAVMPDSTYQRLSAMPIDSLTAREYDMLMRERQVRAQQESSRRTTAIVIGAVAAGVLLLTMVIMSNRDSNSAAARAAGR